MIPANLGELLGLSAEECSLDYIAAIPEHLSRRLGRTVRLLVAAELCYGDGSGEAAARVAFGMLTDALDPEHAGVQHDADVLLKRANEPAQP